MTTSEYPARQFDPVRPARPRIAVSIRLIPADIWALGALILVAAAIRIITIDNQSFWSDEALTAYEAGLPFGAMLHTVGHIETTPPLYFVLIWAWAHVFGTSEVALRSISTIAGIALVPITYLAARELISRWAGVLAAAFVTVNPFMIWYSQEARAYMLLAAFCGASFWFFVRARNDPSRRNLGWWAVFSSLAVMTHFFGGFLVAPEALWLIWVARRRATLIAVGVVAAVQLAILPLAAGDTSHGTGWIAHTSPLHRISVAILEWLVSLLERRGNIPEGLGAGAAVLVLVGLLLVFAGDRKLQRSAGVAAAIAAFVFIAPLALRLVRQDYFLSRNEIPAFVPLITLLAAACVVPRARVAGGMFAIGLLALFSFASFDVQTHARFERPDWRNVARALGPAAVPRAVLVADGTTADPLKIYMKGVTWVQPQNRRQLIKEIVIIGATKKMGLAEPPDPTKTASGITPRPFGRPLPRSVSPPGARLISRFRIDNWVFARFALAHPHRLNVHQLLTLAPQYFRHTPATMLVFMQRPQQ